MSRWHVDAQCHLEPILGPKMVAKWVPKCSKIGPETALKGDSISKLKKEGAESVSTAVAEHKAQIKLQLPLWDPFCNHFGPQYWFQMALRIDIPTRHQT